MKLLELKLNNFQGIRNLSIDFGGKSASVYGDNGTGKTTLYNAMTWLLFDKASTGAKNFTPKTRDGSGDAHHLDHSAEGVFQTDEGRIVTFKKVYHEVYKKKRGSATEEFSGHTVEYYVDGVPEKEKTYTETVLRLFGGDAEKAKMLTMPDYFPEQLDWQTRRKILLDVCGDITDEEIIAGNDDLAELPSFLQMAGTSDQFYSIDEYKKIASAKKAEINKQLTELPARIDEAAQAIPDVSNLNQEELQERIFALQEQKSELEREKASLSVEDIATVELRKQIAELRTGLAEGKSEHARMYAELNAQLAAETMAAQADVNRLRSEIGMIAAEISATTDELRRTEKLRDSLIDEYRAVQQERFAEEQTVCPTCGQQLPDERIQALREEFNLRRSRRLEEINKRGKSEASREMVLSLTDKLSTLHATLSDRQNSLEKAEAERSRLNVNMVTITAPAWETTKGYKEITDQIEALTAKLSDAGASSTEAQKAYDEKIRAVEDDVRTAQESLMSFSIARTQRRRIDELEATEKRLSAEYDELEKGLYLCDRFTKAKVDALTDRINRKFKSVRFRLFQDQINGGLKEGCDVMIPVDGETLVPYADANHAARINAGLEIIDTLSEHWQISTPVVVDNAESVTHLAGTKGQLIRLVVSESDDRLRLEVAG